MSNKLFTNLFPHVCVSLELVAFSDCGRLEDGLSQFRYTKPKGGLAQGNMHVRSQQKGQKGTGSPIVCMAC